MDYSNKQACIGIFEYTGMYHRILPAVPKTQRECRALAQSLVCFRSGLDSNETALTATVKSCLTSKRPREKASKGGGTESDRNGMKSS